VQPLLEEKMPYIQNAFYNILVNRFDFRNNNKHQHL